MFWCHWTLSEALRTSLVASDIMKTLRITHPQWYPRLIKMNFSTPTKKKTWLYEANYRVNWPRGSAFYIAQFLPQMVCGWSEQLNPQEIPWISSDSQGEVQESVWVAFQSRFPKKSACSKSAENPFGHKSSQCRTLLSWNSTISMCAPNAPRTQLSFAF